MINSIRTTRASLFLRIALFGSAATALVLVGLTIAGESVRPINAVLVLMLLTLLISVRFGFLPGLLAALVSDLVLFYFFFEPVLAFWANDPQHAVALVLFVLVAATLGFILETARSFREAASRYQGGLSTTPIERVRLSALEIDAAEHMVFLEGKEIDLTATEFKLLAFFASNAGRLLKHETILAKVWGEGYAEDNQVLRTYVKQLRAKLSDDPAAPRFIRTETGIGYRFIHSEQGSASQALPGADEAALGATASSERDRRMGQTKAGT